MQSPQDLLTTKNLYKTLFVVLLWSRRVYYRRSGTTVAGAAAATTYVRVMGFPRASEE